MTAAQRLRLVLALGLVNIILASVALSVGFVGLQTPPTTAGGPTPGIAFVSPPPTTADRARADPSPIARAGHVDTGHPDADHRSGRRADAEQPDRARPSPTPTRVEPSPPVEPTPTRGRPGPASRTRGDAGAGPRRPRSPSPSRTPPHRPRPRSGPRRNRQQTPVACPGEKADKVATRLEAGRAARSRKPDKAKPTASTHKPKHQHDKAKAHSKHKAEHHGTRHDGHEATVDKAQRGQKSGRRLRIVRRVALGSRPEPAVDRLQPGHPGGVPMAPSDPRQTKFVLDESRIPRAWYNIAADLPVPPSPPLHPGTGQPIGPDDLAPLFPMALIGQEVSAEREIEIPEPVRDAYRLYRPSPLYRAHRLERALDTPAHIYYKYEGVQPGRQPQAEHRDRRRPSTTRKRASSASRPRPAPASGGVPWPSPARSSASRSRSTWSAPATTRSRTAGS